MSRGKLGGVDWSMTFEPTMMLIKPPPDGPHEFVYDGHEYTCHKHMPGGYTCRLCGVWLPVQALRMLWEVDRGRLPGPCGSWQARWRRLIDDV